MKYVGGELAGVPGFLINIIYPPDKGTVGKRGGREVSRELHCTTDPCLWLGYCHMIVVSPLADHRFRA